jgi:hypothetical protein
VLQLSVHVEGVSRKGKLSSKDLEWLNMPHEMSKVGPWPFSRLKWPQEDDMLIRTTCTDACAWSCCVCVQSVSRVKRLVKKLGKPKKVLRSLLESEYLRADWLVVGGMTFHLYCYRRCPSSASTPTHLATARPSCLAA